MNMIELFAVITHVACPIVGAMAAKGHGWLGIVTGLCTGLVIGRGIFLASTYICARVGSTTCKTEKLSCRVRYNAPILFLSYSVIVVEIQSE